MHRTLRLLGIGGAALFLAFPTVGHAQGYQEINMVSDIPGLAPTTDPDLLNPWGIAFSSGSPFWIANNGSGTATLYNTLGQKLGLTVTIPSPGPVGSGGTGGTPTGQVFNGGSGFGGDRFIFSTEDGTISGWNGVGTSALIAVPAANSAVFKSLALLNNQLYAADFHNGVVDVFNSTFGSVSPSGTFTDPNVPTGYAAYNIQQIGSNLFVTFAQQDAAKHDANIGPGLGYVSEFDANGNLIKSFQHGNFLNQPWGLALAPSDFGTFSNDLLVGNFGDGTIDAFDPSSGNFLGTINDFSGAPIAFPGLWALDFGNGGSGGNKNFLYFTAGINDERDGLFGAIAVPEPSSVAALFLGTLSTAGFLLRRRTRKSKA